MKSRFTFALLATLVSFGAMADSVSTSSAQTASQSAANSSPTNNQGITFNSPEGRNNTTTTVRTAPALGGQAFYGSFSQDSCVTAAGGGGSVTGFALNIAAPVSDKHCMGLRAFERTMQAAAAEDNPEVRSRLKQAGRDIMCESSVETRRAYTKAGLCSEEFAEMPEPKQTRDQRQASARQQRDNDIYQGGS